MLHLLEKTDNMYKLSFSTMQPGRNSDNDATDQLISKHAIPELSDQVMQIKPDQKLAFSLKQEPSCCYMFQLSQAAQRPLPLRLVVVKDQQQQGEDIVKAFPHDFSEFQRMFSEQHL